MARLTYDKNFEDKKKISTQITVEDRIWLRNYRGPRFNEPFHVTIHRLIENYKLKDTAELVEKIDRLTRANNGHMELIEKLKQELVSLKEKQKKILEYAV